MAFIEFNHISKIYQTGETRSLELNAYSHGTKGINEYAKDKKRYKGK